MLSFLYPSLAVNKTRRRRKLKFVLASLCASSLVQAVEASYAFPTPRSVNQHRHDKLLLARAEGSSRSKAASSRVASDGVKLAKNRSSSTFLVPIGISSATQLPAASSFSAAPANATQTAFPIVNPAIADPNWTFPQPFDTILSTNFTTLSCPSFFNTFLNSAAFQNCIPLSMLINTSNAFFKYSQFNASTVLPYVINQTCQAPASCTDTMQAYANRMARADACQQDLEANNALAMSAFNAFQSYGMVRQVGCQTNPTDNNFCYVDAVVSNEPSQLYFYYLASGTGLPSGTKADCGSCTQQIMQTYSQYADNSSLLISSTYPAARTLVNAQCGVTFAPLVAATSSAVALFRSPLLLGFGAVILVFSLV